MYTKLAVGLCGTLLACIIAKNIVSSYILEMVRGFQYKLTLYGGDGNLNRNTKIISLKASRGNHIGDA
jgi:hypothetical protein